MGVESVHSTLRTFRKGIFTMPMMYLALTLLTVWSFLPILAPNLGPVPMFALVFIVVTLFGFTQLENRRLPKGWGWFLAVALALLASQIYAIRALDTLQRSVAVAALWICIPFVGVTFRDFRYLSYFTNVSIGMLFFIVIYVFLFGNEFFSTQPVARIGPLNLSLNDLGFYLAITSATAWSLVTNGAVPRLKRLASLIIITLSLIVELMYVGSRAALIGMLIAPVGALVLNSVGRKWGGLFLRLFIIIGSVLGVVWYLYSNAFLPTSIHRRLELLLDPAADGSAMLRVSFAKKAWLMFQDYPISGGGYGNFRFYEYGQSAPVVDRYGHVRYVSSDVHNTHSLYLQIVGETGLFGIVAFGGVMIFFIMALIKLLRAGAIIPLEQVSVLVWFPVFLEFSFFHDTINYYTLTLLAIGYGAIYNIISIPAVSGNGPDQKKKKNSAGAFPRRWKTHRIERS